MNAEKIALEQCARYPALRAADIVKALYQAEFGCGHLVEASADGLKWLKDELAAARAGTLIEPLGGGFCKAHLGGLAESGVSPETLYNIFAASGQKPCGSMEEFQAALESVITLADAGDIPVSSGEMRTFISDYRARGCPATRHSEDFRRAYSPAYRVIGAEYARVVSVFGAIDRLLKSRGRALVAIEGGSASGKTSLAELLRGIYGANVFHMDDFFLQSHQRTPERFAQPGGNVDYERFGEEVLAPLKRNAAFSYRAFDCSVMALGKSVSVEPKTVNIIEGAYSTHPYFGNVYDHAVFLDIPEDEQRARILKRNGPEMLNRFVNEWIPLERAYFEKTGARERCSEVIKNY